MKDSLDNSDFTKLFMYIFTSIAFFNSDKVQPGFLYLHLFTEQLLSARRCSAGRIHKGYIIDSRSQRRFKF